MVLFSSGGSSNDSMRITDCRRRRLLASFRVILMSQVLNFDSDETKRGSGKPERMPPAPHPLHPPRSSYTTRRSDTRSARGDGSARGKARFPCEMPAIISASVRFDA